MADRARHGTSRAQRLGWAGCGGGGAGAAFGVVVAVISTAGQSGARGVAQPCHHAGGYPGCFAGDGLVCLGGAVWRGALVEDSLCSARSQCDSGARGEFVCPFRNCRGGWFRGNPAAFAKRHAESGGYSLAGGIDSGAADAAASCGGGARAVSSAGDGRKPRRAPHQRGGCGGIGASAKKWHRVHGDPFDRRGG